MPFRLLKISVLLITFVFATSYCYVKDNKHQKIELELEKWKKSKDLDGASWAFSAYNITQDSVIASHNEQLRLVPASTLKILTTGTILEISKNFRFKTVFGYKGKINKNGVLDGDILIKGYGDPTLGNTYFGKETTIDSVFTKVYNKLKQLQISNINGNIIADASLFGYTLQPPGYLWEDVGNYYGSGVSSLNINENRIKITFQSGQTIGSPTQIIYTDFHPDSIEYINILTSGPKNSGDNAYIFSSPLQSKYVIIGTIPSERKEFTIYGANPNPAASYGYFLMKFLNHKEIQINGNIKVKYSSDTINYTSFYTHLSPHIHKIIELINTNSHNMSSEAVFRSIAYLHKQQTDYKSASESITEIWKSVGIDVSKIQIEDGSGLSRKNLLTTDFLTNYLTIISKRDYFQNFYNSLSIAGKTGTLSNWFKKSIAENNIRAKTGSMSNIRSIAGYITNKNGDLITFAFIINGHSINTSELKQKIETLLIALYY